MGRPSLHEVPMTAAQRMHRHRLRLREQQLREMETARAAGSPEPTGRSNGATDDKTTTEPHPTNTTQANITAQSAPTAHAACTPLPVALDLLTGNPDAIAARIFEAVGTETAIGIAAALQRRLWQHGSWPQWQPSIIS